MGKQFLGIFFIVALSFTGFGQSTDTAVVNKLNRKGYELLNKDINTAEELIKKAYKLAKENKYTFGEGKSLYYLANIYNIKDNYKNAEEFAKRAIETFGKANLPDEQSKAYTTLGVVYQNKEEYGLAIQNHKKALSLVKKLNYSTLGAINLNIGMVFYYKQDYDSAEQFYNQALELYKRGSLKHEEFNCYRNLSIVAQQRGAYDKALQLSLKGLKIVEQNNELYNVAITYNTIGVIYRNLGDYTKAKTSFNEALEILKNLPYKNSLADVHNGLALVYTEEANLELAFKHNLSALDIYEKLNAKSKVATSYSNIGIIYNKLKEFIKAKQYFDSALVIYKSIDDKEGIIRGNNNIGHIYVETENYTKAVELLESNLKLINKQEAPKSLEVCLNNLFIAYKELGVDKKALSTYLQLDSLQDSLFSKTKLMAINQLNIKYEREKDRRELDNKASTIEILKKEKSLLIVSSVLILIIIIISTLYFRFRSKQNNRIQKLENEKLSNEIHQQEKELLTLALNISQKNELIDEMKIQLDKIQSGGVNLGVKVKEVSKLAESNTTIEKDWEKFRVLFEGLHSDFIKNLVKYCSDLSQYDIRLCSLFRLNLSNQEIVDILNISTSSLTTARYRLRKKLEIDSKTDLIVFLTQLG